MSDLLNRNNLHEEFELEPIELEVKALSEKIEDDPTECLKENIERANDILDLIEGELRNGNFTARLAEVSGQLINSVTNASKEIIANINYKQYLQIREKMVGLKELEIKMKEKQLKNPTNQNLIVTDRETVLRLLEEHKEEEVMDAEEIR